MNDLAAYQRHLEKFGPELLLETAASDLGERDLIELKALVESMERTARFRRGRWIENAMAQDQRQCLECGLDMPRNASSRALRHPHCASKAQRARKAAKAHA